MAVFLFPSMFNQRARTPTAVLKSPVLLEKSAEVLAAVFSLPVVLKRSAMAPLAVLPLPVVLLRSAAMPKAGLMLPVAIWTATEPPAVLPSSSLSVGLGGPPQLSVTLRITMSPAITRPVSRFMAILRVPGNPAKANGIDHFRIAGHRTIANTPCATQEQPHLAHW